MLRLFISSVQKEFAPERAALRDYLRGDPLLRRFFEPFLFEEVPAADRRADNVFLDEVARCDVYLGLFGVEYGPENTDGLSATQREFDLATLEHKHRLIFIKGADDHARHPKMQALIRQVGGELIRRRFTNDAELIAGVYAALVHYLESRELIRHGPFDAAPCPGATLEDLDPERMTRFIREARRERAFPLSEKASPEELLTHLNLLSGDRLTHAAVLLFGRQPQRFLISSEVKCAHFHGTEVAKPIPSYQVYKGTVFELINQAVDFVLSKINLSVGTRVVSTQAPVAYELPPDVVREGIVNAVAHRDYTSAGSVQVMLFTDRLEIWNPGTLPPSLTLESLRHPHGSVPGNPLLAEPLYLTKYIERMGTGTGDMIRRCREAGLPTPEFALTDGFVLKLRRTPSVRRPVTPSVTGQVAPQPESRPESQPHTGRLNDPVTVGQVAGTSGAQEAQAGAQEAQADLTPTEIILLTACSGGPVLGQTLLAAAGYRERTGNFKRSIERLIADQLLAMTLPNKPTSPNQKYRLTANGHAWLDGWNKEGRK